MEQKYFKKEGSGTDVAAKVTLTNQRAARVKMINTANGSFKGIANTSNSKPDEGGYIDFKKSCATFSSTLRNF